MRLTEKIQSFPFLRLIIPFIIGILFGIWFYIPQWIVIFSLFILVCFLFLLSLMPHIAEKYSFRWIYGLIINGVFFCIGALILQYSNNSLNKIVPENKLQLFIGYISELPVNKTNSVKTCIVVTHIKKDSIWIKCNQKILAYFSKTNKAKKLQIGDEIIVKSRLYKIKNLGNPNEFDLKKYYTYQGIVLQSYIDNTSWKKTKNKQGNRLKIYASKIRNYLLSVYKINGLNDNELAVISALTLGYKYDIDYELKKAFTTSGTMHIMAVSGLHVGIIYLFFLFVFSLFTFKKWGRVIRFLLLIIFLWGYALLTGLSPSVVRATIMFSFIVAGTLFQRNANVYNSIGASAFILLLYNPYYLFDMGFQFSYLAVLGIVLFYKPIYSIFLVNNGFIDKLWQLCSVSLAAQISTAALSIYYFQQFPVYFLIANLLAIPLSTLLIYLGAVMLITSPVNWLIKPLAYIVNGVLKIFNAWIMLFEDMPKALIKNIALHQYEVLIIYMLIILITIWIAYKKVNLINFIFLLILFWLVMGIYHEKKYEKLVSLCVYNIPNSSVIQYCYNNRAIIFSDRDFISNVEKKTFYMQRNVNFLKIKKPCYYTLKNDSKISESIVKSFPGLILTGLSKLSVAILYNDSIQHYNTSKPIDVELLIISNNVNMNIDDIIKYVKPHEIIFDSSNNANYIKKGRKDCIKNNLKYFVIQNQGAYIKQV